MNILGSTDLKSRYDLRKKENYIHFSSKANANTEIPKVSNYFLVPVTIFNQKRSSLIFIRLLNNNKTDVIASDRANSVRAIKLLSLLTSAVTSHYSN